MIVFGGGLEFTSPCANDVWVLDHASGIEASGGLIGPATPEWIQLETSDSRPAPRVRHAAVYDPGSNTMIVFGGNDCFSTNYGDVWVLSNANGLGGMPTWTQLDPTGPSPGPRENLPAVYDAGSNRLIFFGGVNRVNFDDVWVLTNANGFGGTPAWIQLSPSGTPPSARNSHSAVYDPTNNRMTIFGGGEDSGMILGDVWVLSDANGYGAPLWTPLGPFPFFPERRSAHTAVYETSTNEMIVFGGYTGFSPFAITNDVWLLDHANGLESQGQTREPSLPRTRGGRLRGRLPSP